jgi:predicted DNA-binding protein YlxM (UPF0122 family)
MGRKQAKQLSPMILKRMYIDKEMSPQDIADIYGITRQAVHDRLKRFGIPVRDKREARLVGIKKGRISYDYYEKEEKEDQGAGEVPADGDEPEAAAL